MFWAALSQRVYHATMPYRFLFRTLGRGTPAELATVFALRKLYSLLAFTALGFLVDRALPPSRHASLRAAIIVAALSAVAEVIQTSRGATEGMAVHVFDIGCGAVGGWLGATLSHRLRAASA